MLDAYRNARTHEEKQHYIQLWGCPAELIETENNRREPDLAPLTREDELLLYKFHRLDARGQAAVLNVLNHEYESQCGEEAIPPAKNA